MMRLLGSGSRIRVEESDGEPKKKGEPPPVRKIDPNSPEGKAIQEQLLAELTAKGKQVRVVREATNKHSAWMTQNPWF